MCWRCLWQEAAQQRLSTQRGAPGLFRVGVQHMGMGLPLAEGYGPLSPSAVVQGALQPSLSFGTSRYRLLPRGH